MTNPSNHGLPPPGNYVPIFASSSAMPGADQRRSSYASIVTGSSAMPIPPRSGAVSHILNPPSDGSDMHSSSLYSTGRSYGLDGARNGASGDEANGASWPSRTSVLPWFSRAFEMYMSRDPLMGDDYNTPGTGFLSPSYLRGSVYLQKLEDAHKSRIQTLREGYSTQPHAPGGLPSNGSSLSLHSTKLSPPSHRGMTFDVVEKPPAFEEDETVSPLPSRWNKDDRHSGIEVLGDPCEVRYTSQRNSSERDHEAYAVRADHHMPPQCGVYYFEILILNKRPEDTTIVIGFASKSVSLSRAPGWEPESWGYHGDDGLCYASQNVGKAYGPKFGQGDAVGCLVNFRTGTAMFTKNGDELGVAFRDVNFRDVKGKLFPIIGLKKAGDHILANFGQLPFQFDIDRYMEKEKRIIRDQIAKADTARLAPPLGETELLQQLVLQFLQHDGYIETARAFAEEIHDQKAALSLDPDVEIEGINIKDDDDANRRQQIRKAVLEGKIDQALKCTNAYYPQVLKDNDQVYFRLRCRKFIEMIRRDAEENLRLEANPDLERKGFSARTGHYHGTEDAEMVDDDDDDDGDWGEHMDTEDGDRDGEVMDVGKLLEEALAYGQELRAEFDGQQQREMAKQLDQIFALIAYPNPLKVKEVSHLLDRAGRVTVAEELNSAILHSLGKSSRAALETLYAQTDVLLEDLRQDGSDGAFVTLKGVIDDIPRPQLFP